VRLALIGDIHLFSLDVEPRRLLGKRLLGHTNLLLNRRFRFNHALLAPLIERVRQIEPDMVLLSGDVTTTSLEDEFLDIERFFRPLADQFPLVIVPGNHDRYTFRSARHRRVENLLQGLIPHSFPHFRELTPNWRLLGLDSARPQVMMSRGALGDPQFQAVARHVADLKKDQGLVVLCHYPAVTPPRVPASWAHALAEARPLKRLLADCPGRIVFMHGHIHRPWHWAPAYGNAAPFTCINAGSPCLTSNAYPLGQGFWQIVLPEDPHQPLSLIHHVPIMQPGENGGRPPSRRRLRRTVAEPAWRADVVL
jgi:3',5'-cyclic AMP phosphodiesterase CpdA